MRRLRMLPLSIAAHVVAALALLIIPLAAEVQPPTPAPLARAEFIPVKAVPVPAAPAPGGPGQPPRAAPTGAPIEAESGILPERNPGPTASVPAGVAVEGGIGGSGDVPGGIGTTVTIPEPPPAPVAPPQPRILRVGGDVREPRKIYDVRPVYPALAQTGHIDGTVTLEAVINQRGTIERIKVLRSVALLDQAAIDAVKQWRYTPTLLNGVPVPVLMTIMITFRLQN